MVCLTWLRQPDLNKLEVQLLDEVLLSDKLHDDPFDIHCRQCRHDSKSTLIEGFRHMLLTGRALTRSHTHIHTYHALNYSLV